MDDLHIWLSDLAAGMRVRPLTGRTLDGAAPFWAAVTAEVLHRLRPDMPAPPVDVLTCWRWLQSLPAEQSWRDIPVPPADLCLIAPDGASIDIWSCATNFRVDPIYTTLLLERPPSDVEGEWQLVTRDGEVIARIVRHGDRADMVVLGETVTVRRGEQIHSIRNRYCCSPLKALAAQVVADPSAVVPVTSMGGPGVISIQELSMWLAHRASIPILARALADAAPGTPRAVLARALASLPDEVEQPMLPLGPVCKAADYDGAPFDPVEPIRFYRSRNGVWCLGIQMPGHRNETRPPATIVGDDLIRLFVRAVRRAADDHLNPVVADGIWCFESTYGRLDVIGAWWAIGERLGTRGWNESCVIVMDTPLLGAFERGETIVFKGDGSHLTVGPGVAVLDVGENEQYVLAARDPAALLTLLSPQKHHRLCLPDEQRRVLEAFGVTDHGPLGSAETEQRISRGLPGLLSRALAGESPCPPILTPGGEVRWRHPIRTRENT